MSEFITIPKHPEQGTAMDFEFLRSEGIKHIQKLAGKVWTDHNVHDPGITILDQLCYAITDLSYRIDYDIEDLLASTDGKPYQYLYSPAEVLTNIPVTINDIRKLVIDVEGVKNAWVEKVEQPQPEIYFSKKDKNLHLAADENTEVVKIRGLYRIIFEKNESTELSLEILPNVKDRLNDNRNICEDFDSIQLLDPQDITAIGTIEVGEIENINQFAANILFRIANHISPQINFYSLQDLLDQGKRIDEIFDGPVLNHGFIDDEELSSFNRKSALHVSDIICAIMDEKGALAANDIALSTGGNAENWLLELDSSKTPKLNIAQTLEKLEFVKQGLKTSIDTEVVTQLFTQIRDARYYNPLAAEERDIVLNPKESRNIDQYYSIQNHFPANYGIGELGLPDSATDHRKAQAKQLKSYLLFFEQILANYLSQIAHVKDLLGFDSKEIQTYFHQSLASTIPDVQEVLADRNQYEEHLAKITEAPSAAAERKNKFLNHLLARFSERFTEYSMLLHGLVNKDTAAKLALDKSNFLKDYPALSSQRAKAFNYKKGGWNTDNISGLEKRIARKLGIENYTRRNLADGNSEGFHMVEHILLRPMPEDLHKYNEYLIPKDIEVFKEATRKEWSLCISPDHGMQTGEEIEIRGSNGYNGIFKTDRVLKNSFEIKNVYTGAGNDAPAADDFGESTPTWVRTFIDTRFLILTYPVDSFQAGRGKSFVRCNVENHGLENGDAVEIVGTNSYNGVYLVSNAKTNSYEIEATFTKTEATGRWQRKDGFFDPYSLQLTFIFPDWVERFKNINFRKFIEKTIREETPVHLTIYIQWLSEDEMRVFDGAYENFLKALK